LLSRLVFAKEPVHAVAVSGDEPLA
jgi:hypothetical protein